jgi:AcrB/AcrD/AcrF family
MCAAATSGSLATEVQEKVAQKVQLPAGYWITWGGQFENLAAARQRLMIVVPGCFFLIFLLLYAALGSPRDALLVSSAFPLALTGGVVHCGCATCRFPFQPRRVYRPIRRGGAERSGDAELHQAADHISEGIPPSPDCGRSL